MSEQRLKYLTKKGKKITAITDKSGNFQFTQLGLEKYTLQVSATGFAKNEQLVEIDSADLKQISVTLYPLIKEDIVVNKDNSDLDLLDSETFTGTQVLTEKDLEVLSDDPQQLSEELQNRAASSGGIPGGAIVTVDGFLSDGRLPSKVCDSGSSR